MVEMLETIGMVLLGGVFVFAGAEHFFKFKGISAQLGARRFPAPGLLLTVGSVVEIVAGLCLMMGIARPYAAATLIGFTILASLMLLDFWRLSGPQRQGVRSGFTINIAVIGGLLIAATSSMPPV